EDDDVERVARSLNIDRADIVDIQWADNGPGWVAVLLASADAVLAIEPGQVTTVEDPVTGSLNASLAQWLTSTGRLTAPYVACQGTALGRRGRVSITQDADGQIWVGGGTVTCVTGTVAL